MPNFCGVGRSLYIALCSARPTLFHKLPKNGMRLPIFTIKGEFGRASLGEVINGHFLNHNCVTQIHPAVLFSMFHIKFYGKITIYCAISIFYLKQGQVKIQIYHKHFLSKRPHHHHSAALSIVE